MRYLLMGLLFTVCCSAAQGNDQPDTQSIRWPDSIFGHLLSATIDEHRVPLASEDYIPFDAQPTEQTH